MIAGVLDLFVKFFLVLFCILRTAEEFKVVAPHGDVVLDFGDLLADGQLLLKQFLVGVGITPQTVDLTFEKDSSLLLF